MPNHYAVLRVNPAADQNLIREAYRHLARRYHPDAAGKAGEEIMKKINAAYEVLSNPERRAEYDRLRSAG